MVGKPCDLETKLRDHEMRPETMSLMVKPLELEGLQLAIHTHMMGHNCQKNIAGDGGASATGCPPCFMPMHSPVNYLSVSIKNDRLI